MVLISLQPRYRPPFEAHANGWRLKSDKWTLGSRGGTRTGGQCVQLWTGTQCDQMLKNKVAQFFQTLPQKWLQQFFLKVVFFKINPVIRQMLGYFLKSICCKKLSKIAKSGHTAGTAWFRSQLNLKAGFFNYSQVLEHDLNQMYLLCFIWCRFSSALHLSQAQRTLTIGESITVQLTFC